MCAWWCCKNESLWENLLGVVQEGRWAFQLETQVLLLCHVSPINVCTLICTLIVWDPGAEQLRIY